MTKIKIMILFLQLTETSRLGSSGTIVPGRVGLVHSFGTGIVPTQLPNMADWTARFSMETTMRLNHVSTSTVLC